MPKNAGAKTEDAAPKAVLPEGEKAEESRGQIAKRTTKVIEGQFKKGKYLSTLLDMRSGPGHGPDRASASAPWYNIHRWHDPPWTRTAPRPGP